MGGHHMNNEINICLIPESFSHPPEIQPAYLIKQGGFIKARGEGEEGPIACIFALCNGGGVSEIKNLHVPIIFSDATLRKTPTHIYPEYKVNEREYQWYNTLVFFRLIFGPLSSVWTNRQFCGFWFMGTFVRRMGWPNVTSAAASIFPWIRKHNPGITISMAPINNERGTTINLLNTCSWEGFQHAQSF